MSNTKNNEKQAMEVAKKFQYSPELIDKEFFEASQQFLSDQTVNEFIFHTLNNLQLLVMNTIRVLADPEDVEDYQNPLITAFHSCQNSLMSRQLQERKESESTQSQNKNED